MARLYIGYRQVDYLNLNRIADEALTRPAMRLITALLVGAAIGINRQRTGRPAGLRSFMIVISRGK